MNDRLPKPINVKDDVWEFVTEDIPESLLDYAVMLQCADEQTAKSILILRRTKYKEKGFIRGCGNDVSPQLRE